MASDEAKLIVRFEAENKKLHAELDRTNKKLNKFQRNSKKELEATKGHFDAAATRIAGRLKAIGGAFVAGVLVKGLVDTSRQFEILRAQLETVEGSQQKAQMAFDRIQDFATRTPFQLQEVVDAFIRLKNRGLDPSEEALTAYGNVAASMGRSLEQFIEAVADSATGEFERLKDFGIKASKQGDIIRFTFRGITTEVQNSSVDIERYLTDIGNVEFAGGMERQMNTLVGVTSNFQDAIGKLALKIDSKTGLTGALKAALRLLTEFTNGLAGVSRPIAEIEAEIEALNARIAAGGRTVGGGRNTTGSNQALLNQLEALRAELKAAQLASTNAVELAKGVEILQKEIVEVSARIEAARLSGESETQGRGRNKALTDLGRDIQLLASLEQQLAQSKEKISSIRSGDFISSLPTLDKELALPDKGKATVKKVLDPYKQGLEEVRSLLESIRPPLKEYTDNVAILDSLLAAGKINQNDYNNALAEYRRRLDDATGANDQWKTDLADAASFAENAKTELERLNEELARAQELAAKGLISPEVLNRTTANIEEAKKKAQEVTNEMTIFAEQAARNIQDQLGDTLRQSMEGSFEGIRESWADMIKDMIAQAAAAQLNRHLFGEEFATGKSSDIGGLIGKGLSFLGFGKDDSDSSGAASGTASSAALTASSTALTGSATALTGSSTAITGSATALTGSATALTAVPPAMTAAFTAITTSMAAPISGLAAAAAALSGSAAALTAAAATLSASAATSAANNVVSIAGAKAEGGPVMEGKTYLVGEEGPELFTPNTAGMIVPNHEMGGTTINFGDIVLPGIKNEQEARRAAGTIKRQIAGAVTSSQRYT